MRKQQWVGACLLVVTSGVAACGDGSVASGATDAAATGDSTGGDVAQDGVDATPDDTTADTSGDGADAPGDDASGDDASADATDAPPPDTGDDSASDVGPDGGDDDVADVGSDVPLVPGDFCDDPSAGSGTTPTPTASGANSFTTTLVECTLSADEVAACAGTRHASSTRVLADTIEITSNAVPNHDAGIFPNAGNPNTIAAQSLTWSIPLRPTRGETARDLQVIGVGLNGIKMEPQTAEVYSSTQWRYEALTFLGRLPSDTSMAPAMTSLGADCNFAHVQPNGEYHYHGNPTALIPETPSRVQVGWAADGHPIFGRWGYADPATGTGDLVELEGSWRVKSGTRASLGAGDSPPPGAYDGTFVQDWEFAEGTGDLDRCNGREETNVLDGRTYEYAYYLTHTYPFMPRCVWGTPGSSFGGGTGPVGPTSCATAADCVGECFAGAVGCDCISSPRDGMICVPTCSTSDDCEDGFTCGPGFCVPAGGPPP